MACTQIGIYMYEIYLQRDNVLPLGEMLLIQRAHGVVELKQNPMNTYQKFPQFSVLAFQICHTSV